MINQRIMGRTGLKLSELCLGTLNFGWKTDEKTSFAILDALSRAYLRNHCRMEAIQADYSLMTRARFEPEAMALCQEQRLAFFARSPLAGGFLARRQGLGNIFSASRRDWLTERFGTRGHCAEFSRLVRFTGHVARGPRFDLMRGRCFRFLL